MSQLFSVFHTVIDPIFYLFVVALLVGNVSSSNVAYFRVMRGK